KKVLTIGLLLFITGSIIAALADNIQLIILGRAIQGMGAIASTGMALIADVSRAEQRTKMMAMVGMSIGMAFILAFITGPILSAWFGLKGLFWITAILAGLALIQLHLFIEEPANKIKKSFSFKEMSHSLKDLRLVSLDTGVFVIHAVMTAVFVVLPLILVEKLGFPTAQHWKIYLPVLLVSILIFVPMIILHEKKKKYFTVISLALLGLAISQLMLAVLAPAIFTIAIILVFYFAFFNFLEASMPSLLSRIAGEKYRGAAMGAYSTSQFLGAFVGSWIAGGLMSAGYNSVFIATALLILLSSVFIALMSKKIQSLP
ncbi:MAG: MFS transporter, partial [Xanthomonadales bacterium]|nr:MFS transporter [Xanthomonadales bacterium]